MNMIILNDLEAYKKFLEGSRDSLIYRAGLLRRQFLSLNWNDNIYQRTKNALNMHFEAMNRIIGDFESMIYGLSRLIPLKEQYDGIK